jgi:low affinity Fe/Cu permease
LPGVGGTVASDDPAVRLVRPPIRGASVTTRPASTPLSRTLHALDRLTSRAATTAVVALVVAVFGVALAIAGFPETWETAFAAAAAAVTTIMVFVIQHTQSREQAATQLKLDELIRAMPQADDHLVHVEAGADEELVELEQRHLEHHHSIRSDDRSSS